MEKNKYMNEMMNVGEKEVDEILLPGFRFHPTDEELVGFYLKRKIQQRPLSIELIKQLDIYKYDPWDLPKIACTGEKEWYFYCPRDRKYRNSARPNRVTRAGFWKATGTDRPIYSSEGGSGSKCIGLKKSLVFYKGRAAKGAKTDWMMHEFRLPSLSHSTISKKCVHTNHPANDSWAICRIFKKTSHITSRTLSHSWLSNPTSHSTLASSTNFSHEICSNVPEYDQILQSPYNSFSLLDHIPTFKPIYPSNYSAINKTCNDIPPSSYTLPQLEDPSEVSISISNDIDISSMLLTMSSSDEGNVEFGTLGNINEGYHEFGNVEDYHFLDRFGNNNNEQDNIPCTLFEDLDNRMFVEDDIDHTAGLIQVSEWLPLAMHEAWKSSTSSSSFMWDYAPPLS